MLSCQEIDQIGLSQINTNDIEVRVDSFLLTSKTVLVESPQTSQRGFLWVGEYQDPVFGYISAEGFATIQLIDSLTDLDFSLNPDIDSIIFNLPIRTQYGNSIDPFSLEIRKLDQPLEQEREYLYNDTHPLGTTEIADFRINFNDNYNITFDTLIRVRANRDFEQTFFDGADNNSFLGADNFASFFPGISFSTGLENNGLIRIVTSAPSCSMDLFYSYPDSSSNNRIRLNLVNFTDINENPYDNPINHFFSVTTDRTGTALEDLVQEGDMLPPGTDSLLYVQPLTGVLPLIDFQPFLDYLDNIDRKFIINQAFLSMAQPVSEELAPHEEFIFALSNENGDFITRTDSTNQLRFLLAPNVVPYDYSINTIGSEAFYRVSNDNNVDLTYYITSYLDGFNSSSAFLIYPRNFTSRASRSVIRSNRIYLHAAITILNE